MDRSETLLAGFLEGDLSADETAELARLLEGDATLQKRFQDLAGMDGLLRARLAPSRVEDDLVERISMVLVDSGQEARTAAGIMDRIEDKGAHRPTPRRLRAVRPPSSSPSLGVIWGLLAAGALVARSASDRPG